MVVPAARIDRVLNVVMKEMGVTLVAFDYKDLARQYLGELLPQMETLEANQFEAQGDYVPYVPEPTQTTIEQSCGLSTKMCKYFFRFQQKLTPMRNVNNIGRKGLLKFRLFCIDY